MLDRLVNRLAEELAGEDQPTEWAPLLASLRDQRERLFRHGTAEAGAVREIAERLIDFDRDGTRLKILTSCAVMGDVEIDEAERCAILTPLRQLRRLRNEFIEANLALVMFAVRRYQRSTSSTTDLFQEGCIGLMKAVDRFDHKRGSRFSTYALWWIRHSIGNCRWQSRPFRVPAHVALAYERSARAQSTLQTRLGRTPDAAELAAATGMPKVLIDAISAPEIEQATWVSLDTSSREDTRTVGDTLAFRGQGDDESIQQKVLVREISEHIDQLPERVAEVLRKRFALGYDSPATLQEIGHEHGVTRERIRQIEARGIEMLRERIEKRADRVAHELSAHSHQAQLSKSMRN